jgi:putative protein kinase ArgK-like GTPase of G3E family
MVYNRRHQKAGRGTVPAAGRGKAMGVAVLITGRPGVGKTTMIERIVACLPGLASH